ncbi:Hypothetical protein NocV09_03300720 [Nannochloropsis oceanica]
MQFQVPLPEVPLGPRFLTLDSLANLGDLISYKDSVPLASQFKYALHSDISLGIEIDTIDRKKWQPPPASSLPPSLHPDDMALLEWDLFKGKQKRAGEDGEEAGSEAGREAGGEREEDTGGVATAGQVAAPWMLRPRYETTVTYDCQEEREGGRHGRRKNPPKAEGGEDEEEEEEQGGAEVFDESRQEGWEAAIARTFDEARRGEGLAPREEGGKGPLWVAEIVPDLEQWANELVVVHFGNELRGREEEAAMEAPLFVLEGGREEGLVHGTTVKAGYMRGRGHVTAEAARVGGGVVSKAFEPARYYQLEVTRTDGGGGEAAPVEGDQQQQQYLLLLVQPETGVVSMCPTVANVKVKKVDRAASGKPARGVQLVHRPLGEEEAMGRVMKLMKAGLEEEEAVEYLK